MALPKKKNSDINVQDNAHVSPPSKLNKNSALSLAQQAGENKLPLNERDFEVIDEIETRGLKINLPGDFKQGENLTRIKLVTARGQEILLTAEDAKRFIDRASDEIDKIVIEQLRQEGADRYSLHLNNNQKNALHSSNSNIEKLRPIDRDTHEKKSLKEIEEEINSSFLDGNLKHAEKALIPNASNSQIEQKGDAGEQDYVYRQRIFIRKRQKKGSDYFYRAENHIDLYNIGQSYMSDFKEGKKSFAFIGEDARDAKEKTIFGLCSFFNYHTDATVTIVTKNMDQTFYHSYVPDMKSVRKKIEHENISFTLYECSEFQVIEFDELVRIAAHLRTLHVEDFLQEIIDESDLVFWDLPSKVEMALNRAVYFPTLRSIDNVTLMISEAKTNFEFINNAKEYFKKYGIKIKGALINKDNKK